MLSVTFEPSTIKTSDPESIPDPSSLIDALISGLISRIVEPFSGWRSEISGGSESIRLNDQELARSFP
jgi:hypothetical protein